MWWYVALRDAGLSAILSACITAVLGYVVIHRKMRLELKNIRLEGEVAASKRAAEIATTLEAYKLETAKAHRAIAETLAATTHARQATDAVTIHKLEHLTTVAEKSQTALERVEHQQRMQSKLFTARAMTAAAIVALQTSKGLAEKELAAERAKHAPRE